MITQELSRDELLWEVRTLEAQERRLAELSIPLDQQALMSETEIQKMVWEKHPDFGNRYYHVLEAVFADLRY